MADQLEILTLSSVLIAHGSDKPGMEQNGMETIRAHTRFVTNLLLSFYTLTSLFIIFTALLMATSQ